MAPCVLAGSLLSLPHPMFDLGECLFDRIEVGRVFRQKPQPRPGRFDGILDGFGFVRTEIVGDDNLAGLEGRDQLLVHIGAEALAVDRAIEDAGRGELIAAERAEEGQGAPAAMRSKAVHPFALWPPAPQRRHVGSDPSFVDEDQTTGIKTALPGFPAPAVPGDIGTALLKGE